MQVSLVTAIIRVFCGLIVLFSIVQASSGLKETEEHYADESVWHKLRLANPEHYSEDVTYSVQKCGGPLVGNSGYIEYRDHALYADREICVWTVRVKHEYVRVKLEREGFERHCDYILLSTIKDLKNPVVTPEHVLKHGNSSAVIVKGPIMFVTFASDKAVRGQGFRLIFEGFDEYAPEYSYNYLKFQHLHYDYHDDPNSLYSLQYPLHETYYADNELVTIVLNPPRTTSDYLRLILTGYYMEDSPGCTADVLNIQTFTPNIVTNVLELGLSASVCGSQPATTVYYSTERALILVFKSNQNVTGTGFYGFWSISP